MIGPGVGSVPGRRRSASVEVWELGLPKSTRR